MDFGPNRATNFSVAPSGTSITATSPAGTAGTVNITVSVGGETSSTSSADQFTYQTPVTVTSIGPATAPTAGGTTLTIIGTGFTSAATVDFGPNRATNFSVAPSGTSITATSPAGTAGTVNITVSVGGETSSTSSADQFTYLSIPTVSSVTPSQGAAGDQVIINGSGFTGAEVVRFGSVLASFTVVSNTAIDVIVPAPLLAPIVSESVEVSVATAGGTGSAAFTYNGLL